MTMGSGFFIAPPVTTVPTPSITGGVCDYLRAKDKGER